MKHFFSGSKIYHKYPFAEVRYRKNAKEEDKTSLSGGPVLFPGKRNHTHPFGSSPEDAANRLSPSSSDPTANSMFFRLTYHSPIALTYTHSRRENFEVSAICSVCLEMQFA